MTALRIEDVEHPYNPPRIPVSDWDGPWFLHPQRGCKDRPEFSDLSLIPKGGGREARIQEMVNACLRCPVLRECREDMLSMMSDYEIYGVRAAYRGKS